MAAAIRTSSSTTSTRTVQSSRRGDENRLRGRKACAARPEPIPWPEHMSSFFSRGFSGRRRVPDELADRVPPGQYVEDGFPVLTAGPTPHIDPEEWTFRIDGM